MERPVRAVDTDVLVIGAGGAGARAALEAAACGARVLVVSKGPPARSGITPLAGGDLVAALGHGHPSDNPGIHLQDLVATGRYLADQDLAGVLVSEAPDRLLDLERYGVRFRKSGGRFFQYASPGETYPRTAMIEGKGFALMRVLKKRLREAPRCTVAEDVIISRLLTDSGGAAAGAVGLEIGTGSILAITAGATILATGGNGQLWPLSDTPPESTGDGYALAYGCGAELVDMEMVLYYPTVMAHPRSARGVIIGYEHLLNPEVCGGRLLNRFGQEFLAPGRPPVRDILMQHMFAEIRGGRGTEAGALYLDLSHSPGVKEKARRIINTYLSEEYRHLRKVGVDLLDKPAEVAPATHYTLGGVRIDSFGRTTVEGLFAAGEVAGNVHGANRMSGNALAETQVFGQRAGKAAVERAMAREAEPDNPAFEGAVEQEKQFIARLMNPDPGRKGSCRPADLKEHLQRVMGTHAGFPRDREGLQAALREVETIKTEHFPRLSVPPVKEYNLALVEAIELAHMLVNAELVARSALVREESRGHHRRSDFPATDNGRWLRHTRVQKRAGSISLDTVEVVTGKVPVPPPVSRLRFH